MLAIFVDMVEKCNEVFMDDFSVFGHYYKIMNQHRLFYIGYLKTDVDYHEMVFLKFWPIFLRPVNNGF